MRGVLSHDPLRGPGHRPRREGDPTADHDPLDQDSIAEHEQDLPELFARKYDLKKEALQDSVEQEISGFRIQLFKYEDLRTAKDRESEVIQYFGEENVRLIFEEPFHKIRVGRFRNREEAEEYREYLVRMGYRNPIIVPDKVTVLVPRLKK